MSYINQIVEDGVTYDIAAKNLVNGFTQTTPGVNALDAAAGKSLNDSLANLSTDVSTNYATKTELANTDTRVGGFSAFSFLLGGGASKVLTVENDARFAIIFSGRYVVHQGMAIFGSNGSGAITETDIHLPTNISFTTANNRLTMANNHASNSARVLVVMLTESPCVSQ